MGDVTGRGGFVSVGSDSVVKFGVTDYIEGKDQQTESEPKVSCYENGLLAVGQIEKLSLYKGDCLVDELVLDFTPDCMAIESGELIVSGVSATKKFDVSGGY